jgi:hypothetical protein
VTQDWKLQQPQPKVQQHAFCQPLFSAAAVVLALVEYTPCHNYCSSTPCAPSSSQHLFYQRHRLPAYHPTHALNPFLTPVCRPPDAIGEHIGLGSRQCQDVGSLQVLDEQLRERLRQQVPGWRINNNKEGLQCIRQVRRCCYMYVNVMSRSVRVVFLECWSGLKVG